MSVEATKISEGLVAISSLSLTEFCTLLSEHLNLPFFSEDSENETEWAEAGDASFAVNVSRPYKRTTLHKWDKRIPVGYNFDISLNIGKEASSELTQEWLIEKMIPTYGKIIANICQCEVIQIRGWPRLINDTHYSVYRPDGSD
ncbi:MAG: hypothetical protein ACRYFS_07225 [Janthinobacterium lividum]